MTPYYQDESVTIYHGDCREVMPTLDGDVLVTDPPYGTGYYSTDLEVLTPGLLLAMVATYRSVAVFGWPEKLVALCGAAGLVPNEWITWWPTNGRVRGFNKSGLWREVECIAVFGGADWGVLRQPRQLRTSYCATSGARGKPQSDEARMGDVWRDESPNLNLNQPSRLHPNEKPVALLLRLLQPLPAGVVLDPFMGSGTTLRAAKDSGRQAIGIEIEERYCEIAARRMAQEVLAI